MTNLYAPPATRFAASDAVAALVAPRWRRLGARLLDTLLVTGLFIYLREYVSGKTGVIVFTLFDGMALWAYAFALQAGVGQTIGKRVFKLEVVTLGLARPGPFKAALRTIVYFVQCAIWTFATIALIAPMQAGVFLGSAEAVDTALAAARPFLPQLVEGICLALAALDQAVAMFTERRQSLGDLLAGTIVIDHERARRSTTLFRQE